MTDVVYPKLTYNATPPTVADKTEINAQCDAVGHAMVTRGRAGLNMTITGTTPAAPGTAAVGSVLTGLDMFGSLQIIMTTVGATGGVLDLYLQTSFDGGTTWVDYAHLTQLAAGAGSTVKVWKVSRAQGDSGASAPVAVGTGLSPALAAGTILGGEWGDQMRLVAVAGASTTLGAAQTLRFVGGR